MFVSRPMHLGLGHFGKMRYFSKSDTFMQHLKDMSTIIHTSRRTARTTRKLRSLFELCPRCSHRHYSKQYVRENDIVLLEKKGIVDNRPILTNLLEPTGRIHTHRGVIDHANVIGKEFRNVVYTNKGAAYRIHQPTLSEYVRLSPRMVTPVYPADANLIVSLLDIHPSNPEDGIRDEPFEIFEAGTGHGALTLHLARAIHGLNPAPPPLPTQHTSHKTLTGELTTEALVVPSSSHIALEVGEASRDEPNLHNEGAPSYDEGPQPINKLTTNTEHKSVEEARFEAYLPSRRAVIRTLDISGGVSKHAQSTIRKFRRGLYYHNIDFHVGTIPDYLSSRLATTNEPFLEHAILDLPNPDHYLKIVSQSLKPNGSLIVFCPSITQIVNCIKLTGEKKLPFHLDTVLEVGPGAGVGGREWDVRAVKPRAVLKAQAEARMLKEQSDAVSDTVSVDDVDNVSSADEDSGWAWVCRPKVGGLVSGGGFLALWRRLGGSSASRAHQPQPMGAVDMEPTDLDEPDRQPAREPEGER